MQLSVAMKQFFPHVAPNPALFTTPRLKSIPATHITATQIIGETPTICLMCMQVMKIKCEMLRKALSLSWGLNSWPKLRSLHSLAGWHWILTRTFHTMLVPVTAGHYETLAIGTSIRMIGINILSYSHSSWGKKIALALLNQSGWNCQWSCPWIQQHHEIRDQWQTSNTSEVSEECTVVTTFDLETFLW